MVINSFANEIIVICVLFLKVYFIYRKTIRRIHLKEKQLFTNSIFDRLNLFKVWRNILTKVNCYNFLQLDSLPIYWSFIFPITFFCGVNSLQGSYYYCIGQELNKYAPS